MKRIVTTLSLLFLAATVRPLAAAEPSTSGAAGDTLSSPYAPVPGPGGEVEIWRMPALASEDTFGVRLRYEAREIEVQGTRVSLREILEKAKAGERRRREAVADVSYTEDMRAAAIGARFGDPDRRRFFEQRSRIYFKHPHHELRIALAEREYGDQKEREETRRRARVSVEVNDALDFASAPFYLEDIDSYTYAIRERKIFPDRVLYAVAFHPRSEFDVLPSGTFWIDTAEYVVVHEELGFDRNPAPLLFKSLDHIVRERRRIDGHWVVTRLQLVVELRSALLIGFRRAELEVTYSDFAFNSGLNDAIFERER
jgi:hypothetical protein